MSLRESPDFDRHDGHDGWLAAALVFAAALLAAVLLLSVKWNRASDEEAVALGASNTRPLVILPIHLR